MNNIRCNPDADETDDGIDQSSHCGKPDHETQKTMRCVVECMMERWDKSRTEDSHRHDTHRDDLVCSIVIAYEIIGSKPLNKERISIIVNIDKKPTERKHPSRTD